MSRRQITVLHRYLFVTSDNGNPDATAAAADGWICTNKGGFAGELIVPNKADT